MATFPQHTRLTIEDYLEFCRAHPDQRYELIDGQLRMMAGGSLDHSRIATNINALLAFKLPNSCQALNSDAIFKLPSGNCVLPDMIVTCDERDHSSNKYIEYPSVVFEVLSPGTESIDRGQKFTDYRDCPLIQEYVMINTKEPLIELFRREKEKLWTYHMFELDDTLTLTSIHVSLNVKDIYKNVLFK